MRRRIYLSEDDLRGIICHYLIKLVDEGIKFNRKTYTVSYDPDNEDYLDTSLDSNPSKNSGVMQGVDAWSVFKRKRGNMRGDGNPALYALKGENGWTIDSQSKKALIDRAKQIIQKFLSEHHYNATIVVPSTNQLNYQLATWIKEKDHNINVIDDLIRKMTVQEVNDAVDKKGSAFHLRYGNDTDDAYERFCSYCDRMGGERAFFRYHFIPEMDMRDAITQSMKMNDNKLGDYIEAINNQDILIIDDSITSGRSLKQAAELINQYYAPKKIVLFSLFSQLYNQNG